MRNARPVKGASSKSNTHNLGGPFERLFCLFAFLPFRHIFQYFLNNDSFPFIFFDSNAARFARGCDFCRFVRTNGPLRKVTLTMSSIILHRRREAGETKAGIALACQFGLLEIWLVWLWRRGLAQDNPNTGGTKPRVGRRNSTSFAKPICHIWAQLHNPAFPHTTTCC